MAKGLQARFIGLYLFLGMVVLAAGLGAYSFATMGSKADASKSAAVQRFHEREIENLRRQQGTQNLTAAADAYIGQRVATQGLTTTKITVRSVKVKGDNATVVADVVITNGYSSQLIEVTVVLRRGVWQGQSIAAA